MTNFPCSPMFLLQSSIAVSIYLVAWHYDAHCFTPRFQQQFLYLRHL